MRVVFKILFCLAMWVIAATAGHVVAMVTNHDALARDARAMKLCEPHGGCALVPNPIFNELVERAQCGA